MRKRDKIRNEMRANTRHHFGTLAAALASSLGGILGGGAAGAGAASAAAGAGAAGGLAAGSALPGALASGAGSMLADSFSGGFQNQSSPSIPPGPIAAKPSLGGSSSRPFDLSKYAGFPF